MKRDAVVISVTKKGDKLGEHITEELLKYPLYQRDFLGSEAVKSEGFRNLVARCFKEYNHLIFISSTGIAVRGIDGLLEGKTKDPAVLVVDCTGKFAISLLSGHLGGANELTQFISVRTDAAAVITTATDNLGVTAPDMVAKKHNLLIDDMKICKEVAAVMVNGGKVGFFSGNKDLNLPKGMSRVESMGDIQELDAVVIIDDAFQVEMDGNIDIPVLRLMRKNIILGIGCRRDFSPKIMRERVRAELDRNKINPDRICGIYSIDIKKDERAIMEFAEELEVEFCSFSSDKIKKIHMKYEGSDFVEKITGVRCVCEPVIELAGGVIIHPKVKLDGMTLAVGIRL